MISFILRIKVQSNRRKDFLDTAGLIIEPTLVLPGCMSCRVTQDLNDPDIAFLVEEWETRGDLDRHMASDEFRIILSMIELSIEKPEITISTISGLEGFEAIEKIRCR